MLAAELTRDKSDESRSIFLRRRQPHLQLLLR
jgi:hypothetical protein